MKKFLQELKSLEPEISESLEQRILRDTKPLITVKQSFSYRSFFAGSLGGTCVGLLIGMFLFSITEPSKIVENPPETKTVEQPQLPKNDTKPLELDSLIAQLDRRNRAWEKTTIPASTVKTWIRSDIDIERYLQ